MRGARPHTASQIRPHTASASHNLSCDLSEPIRREHGLSRTRPLKSVRPWESDRTLAGEAMRLAVKSVRRPRDGQHRPVCVRGRSASHTASHFGLSDRPLTHTGRLDSSRSNAFSCENSQTAPRIGLSAGVRERPIGLSNL